MKIRQWTVSARKTEGRVPFNRQQDSRTLGQDGYDGMNRGTWSASYPLGHSRQVGTASFLGKENRSHRFLFIGNSGTLELLVGGLF